MTEPLRESDIPWPELRDVTDYVASILRERLRRPAALDWCRGQEWCCFQTSSDEVYAQFNWESVPMSRGMSFWLSKPRRRSISVFPPGEIRPEVAAHELGHAFDFTLGRRVYNQDRDYCTIESEWKQAINLVTHSRDDEGPRICSESFYCESFAEWFFISQYMEPGWALFHQAIKALPARMVSSLIERHASRLQS